MAKPEEVQARWLERVAAQEASGLSVRVYCKEQGLGEHSFYQWRQRLKRESESVGFALVQTKAEARQGNGCWAELLLPGGERLRIPCEEAALRAVRPLAE